MSFFLPTQIGSVTMLPGVRRLIRDGVDVPLANLFVGAAQRRLISRSLNPDEVPARPSFIVGLRLFQERMGSFS